MNRTDQPTQVQIIGWGLAGASLAWQLHFRNTPFVVHDSGQNYSTRIAAGIANPIVFKRLTKTWNVDVTMPYAEAFYARIAHILGVELVSGKNILYPFTHKEDENNWSARMGDDRFKKYMEHTTAPVPPHIHAPCGLGKVNTFGNLDTNLFLDASRAFFLQAGYTFHPGRMDYRQPLEDAGIDFIFCEGIDVIQNPFFNYLPMKTSHGETLVIESDELRLKDVVSKNLFILPLGENRYKIGATYNWEIKEPVITDLGKADLVERLENLIDCSYNIVDHQAGIRPTVADRRPLLGVHSFHSNLFIFNGLGTKGVLLAPYYSGHFTEFYLDKIPIEPEVNIQRFHRRFLKS